MVNFQHEFGSSEPVPEAKWQVVQARVTPDEKTEIFLYCKSTNLNYSVLTRIIWRKIINNWRTMPQVRQEPTKEIDTAISEVETYLPIIIRQKKIAPRLF
jgi:hypothetical protein